MRLSSGPTEREFTAMVLELARLRGWLSLHIRPARTAHGWRTAVQGSGKGFPDLLLVRPRDGRIVVAELKTGRGKVTAEQAAWLAAFRCVDGIEVHEWRPVDWAAIEAALA